MKTKYYTSLIIFISLVMGLQAQAQVEGIESKNTLYYYSGTLGINQKVEFNLQLKGLAVSGSYIVENSGAMYVFSGRLAVDRNGMGVLVYDKTNDYVGSIEATFISSDSNFGRQLNGRLKSANGKRIQELKLKKVAEFAHIDTTDSHTGSFGD